MSKRVPLLFFLTVLVAAGNISAQTSLFYIEIQGVAGYSSSADKWIYYSLHPDDVMQKPSLGFDYVQRFSRETGDFAVLAVQARLAWDADGEKKLEPQLYNAYLKFKFPGVDFWLGHNRPAFGLSSAFDVHSQVLPTLVMYGYGYDRDWGAGLGRDFSRGSWGFSLTTGSGMPLQFGDNYLFSGRLSFGVLGRDNWSLGLSAGYGEALETMGYALMSPDPKPFRMAGVDIAHVWNNLENRVEAVIGRKFGLDAWAVFWRLGVNLLDEERLKWEIQPILMKEGGKTGLKLGTGLSFVATGNLTLRVMYAYDREQQDSRIVFQVYYYKRLVF
jgi:opacity protein-like surface antigen